MSHLSSPREAFETVLQPLTSVPLERELPIGQRLWQQGWIRKSLILILLAVLWEVVARVQNNDLLLPTFLQTAQAFGETCGSTHRADRVGAGGADADLEQVEDAQ